MSTNRNPVRAAPSLFHLVALVQADPLSTLREIRSVAGRKPDLYTPVKQLTGRILNGMSYEWAYKQAETLPDERQRRSALEVLPLLKEYLETADVDWIKPFSVEPYRVGRELYVPIKLAGLMSKSGEFCVLGLHFWRKRLQDYQFRAALTMLKDRLESRTELRGAKLNILDASVDLNGHRQFRIVDWNRFVLMGEDELTSFNDVLYHAWHLYEASPQDVPPRPRKQGPQTEMF